ncbi:MULTISPECIES: acyltransferase [Caulobacter]|jgi:peptidoglycan/LPS O-acetylase OafA/YrhL|uniref:Putative acyltransferase n=1 Tax=Caulobacter vibrioides OR37 TaxID=1292034 RepID=R0E934_CAUVI|nr:MULTISPECIES: acyltransferase [Caulobacter]ENZ81993.1 putative acyltransferase [Caulobacter vibrioides OR37]MBQ1560993.1 acyltransferase [Caulobacter sp.]
MPDAANIKPLTAFRFFAALWVVLYHYWPKLDVGFVPAIAAKGYLGVEAFFILSGFILCHVYLRGFGEGRFQYGDFLWNRLARVYPLHLATLVGIGAMAIVATIAGLRVDPNILSWPSLPANLLLVHAWGFAPTAGWNHASWSISAEWFAYLAFPVFAFAAWRLRERPVAAVLGALALIAGLYPAFEALAGFPLTAATIQWGALRIVPCFAYGCALHALWRSERFPGRLSGPGAAFLGAAVLAAVQFGAPDRVIIMLLGGLIFMLATLAATGFSFAGQSVFVYLGEISYSTYMICIPWKILAINATAKLINIDSERLPLVIWALIVLSLIPLSAASFHVLENPCREKMKSWAKRWKQRRFATVGAT